MLDGCVPWPEEFAARYREAGYWRGETLGDALHGWAARYGDAEALVDDGARVTYRQLDDWADRLAAGFASRGIASRERVLVQLPNSADFVAVCFALFRTGAVPVFTLPSFRASEIGHLAELSEAKAWVITDVFKGFDYREFARAILKEQPQLQHVLVAGDPGPDGDTAFTALRDIEASPVDLPRQDPSDVAFFLLSGGTTAMPKLIHRTHDDYALHHRSAGEIAQLTSDDGYLTVLPAQFTFPWGCPGVLGTLACGGKVVLVDDPSPEACFPLIEREGVTFTALSPTLVHMWLDGLRHHDRDLSSLRLIQVGGSKLQDELARRIEPAFGTRLQQAFGMSEGFACFTRLDDSEQTVLTTQGRPMTPGDEVRVLDSDGLDVPEGAVGELTVRGPTVQRGYYRSPDHDAKVFTEDGFQRTGDLVRLLPDGNLVVEGRIKDVINRGGEKVSATEVEGHLVVHPCVEQAAVVPLPDEILGERTYAFVVVSPFEIAPGLAELRRFLRERGLATYKLPDRIEAVDSLPLTGLNKVDKKALAARLRARTGTGV